MANWPNGFSSISGVCSSIQEKTSREFLLWNINKKIKSEPFRVWFITKLWKLSYQTTDFSDGKGRNPTTYVRTDRLSPSRQPVTTRCMHWKCSTIDGWEGKHKREQRKYNDRQAVLTVDADVNGDGNVVSNWKYRVTMPVVICHNQPAVCISFQATTNHTNNKHTKIQWKIIKTKQKLCDVALGLHVRPQ